MNNNALRNHINKKREEGDTVECEFESLAEEEGYFCMKSSSTQDWEEHWDYKLIKDGVLKYVDVKAKKRGHDEGYTWVELKNVHGEDGWLYAKKLDYVVFEKDDRFDFVDIKKLRDLINEKVMFTYHFSVTEDISEMEYCKYKRDGRFDVIVLTPYSDLDKLVVKSIMKK